MKKIITMLLLLSLSIIHSQSSFKNESNKFNKLISYTPKAFCSKEKIPNVPKSWNPELNTIYALHLISISQKAFRLTKARIAILKEKINELSIAFYLENNPIILEYYGGYSGCYKSPIDTTFINNQKITVLRFCYTCIGRSADFSECVAIFNNRTIELVTKN